MRPILPLLLCLCLPLFPPLPAQEPAVAAVEGETDAAAAGETPAQEAAPNLPSLGPGDEARFLPQILPAADPAPAPNPSPPTPAPGRPIPAAPGEPTATAVPAPPTEPVQAAVPEVAEPREASVTLADGSVLPYQVRTGTVQLLAEDGETVRGEIFYTEYRRLASAGGPPQPPAERPLLFSFNGGPGSSSVWLHLGAFGPRVVDFPGEGLSAPRPPVALVENPDTLLDAADLVFVDPIGTGFSRAQGETKADEFYNLDADLESCAEFISRYLSHGHRWASPVFLAGESYGAMRVAGLAPRLQERGVPLRGVALVSGLIDFATISDEFLSAICLLPTYVTVGDYHQRALAEHPERYGKWASHSLPPRPEGIPAPTDPDPARRLLGLHNRAVEFARATLAPALLDSGGDENAHALEIGAAIGLNPDLVERSDLAVDPAVFRDQLLPGLTLGRFDARVTGPDTEPLLCFAREDPSLSNVLPAFTNAANLYFRDTLEIERPLDYTVLGGVNWSWNQFQNRYASVTEALDEALVTDPHLQLFLAMGFYDLATPPEGIRHSLRQLDHGAGRWEEHWYEGGHMMYLVQLERTRLNADLRGFLRR